jgi:signal transduction histidine kinase
MDRTNSSRRPSFFWQGLMILLPVLVLAVVGLYSLRQDAQAAEQAARKRAAENAQSLARAVGDMAGEELVYFLNMQNEWMNLLDTALPDPAYTFPDADFKANIVKWERTYPGLKLAALAMPKCEILTNGRQMTLPEIAATPSPPAWYCELTPEQRELWEALRQSQGSVQDFLNTSPSADARLAAQYAHLPPETILKFTSAPSTETGISFLDLACYQILNAQTTLTRPPLAAVWQCLFRTPSFVAPALLELAEGKTNGADSSVQENVRWMRQFWDSQSATRRHLEPLRKLPEFQSGSRNSIWARWSQTPSDRALAFFEPCLHGSSKDRSPHDEPGWNISFVPGQVIEAIFTRALAENQFLVPDYAVAAISIENEPLSISGGSSGPEEKSPLAIATRQFGEGSARPNAASLSVAFYLTSREKMLAAEQRRARLFGALIGAAVLAALAGLLTARRAFYQQHRLGEMKTNFVSSVSHELRAPIASMRLLAESLERGKIPETARQQEYYRFLVQESRRLTSLIENVLDFSRIEQGRKEYQFEPADLDALAAQTVQLMVPAAVEKQVELAWFPGPGPGPLPSCDGLAIQQALINLIDNAIKHSPAGARVTVGREVAAPNLIHLWVEDHGPGIPPDEHEKIFERFYRRGSELRRETQGVGIGLTIVKHIIEAHGGRVLVRSAVGQGSRFTLELPVNGAETSSPGLSPPQVCGGEGGEALGGASVGQVQSREGSATEQR